MKKLITVSFIIMSLIALVTCGGSSSPGTPPSSIPIAIEGLDGKSGVSVNSVFDYTFGSAPDSSTVTEDTFYIYQTLEGDSAKNAAEISAQSDIVYRLSPSAPLSEGTSYTIVVKLSLITDADGVALGDDVYVMFTTNSEESALAISSVVDGNYAVINSAGSTGVDPTTIRVSFTKDVVASDDIALNCDLPNVASSAQPEISTDFSPAAVDITIIGDAYDYQLFDCTLAVGTNIMSEDGLQLSEAGEYVFTNGCGSDDAFFADSFGTSPEDSSFETGSGTVYVKTGTCWTFASFIDLSIEDIPYSISGGELEYQASSVDYDLNLGGQIFQKGFEAESLTVTALMRDFINSRDTDQCWIQITNYDSGEMVKIGMYNDASDTVCILYNNGVVGNVSCANAATFFRLVYDSGSIEGFFGDTLDSMVSLGTTNVTASSSFYAGFVCSSESDTAPFFSSGFDYITFSETATDQY